MEVTVRSIKTRYEIIKGQYEIWVKMREELEGREGEWAEEMRKQADDMVRLLSEGMVKSAFLHELAGR